MLSLTARGLTTGEAAAHLDEVYGAKVSKDTISRITDKVLEEMTEWAQRPLNGVYPVLFIDAIHVKVRDGQVTNRPFYVVIGVTVDGHRDVLGIWAGQGGAGEGAKYWLQVLTELKNRGVADVCIAVCDGLKGLPESITTVWPQTVVQACILHLIRNTFRYASRRDWDQMGKDLKPVYTAPTEAAASARFDEFTQSWGGQYPAIIALWRAAWSEFVPFLDYAPRAHRDPAPEGRPRSPLDELLLRCVLISGSFEPPPTRAPPNRPFRRYAELRNDSPVVGEHGGERDDRGRVVRAVPPARWMPRMPRGWCTVTSSPPTCWSPGERVRTTCTWSTSGSRWRRARRR